MQQFNPEFVYESPHFNANFLRHNLKTASFNCELMRKI